MHDLQIPGGKKIIFKIKGIVETFSTQMPESIIKNKQKPKQHNTSFSYTLTDENLKGKHTPKQTNMQET